MLELFYNKIFIATVFSTVLAQLIKTLLDVLQTKRFERSSLFRGAGMPSSHTSTVVSLSIGVFIVEGVNTVSIITFVFASIVVRDVIGDKVFATQQQNIINIIIQDIVENKKIERNHLIGHSALEVLFGILIAIFSIFVIFVLF
ncbi:divergent PAP2 family protein [Candidatus Vampirococcus lugosii]|uniref:Acid phosphatase family membrane protein YuiD n=1 Tax=Candidatus Vampirococcus lugosii TaxID=2789015 RepID=A0ABS5QJE5_9BACT|nr:divergent PAP2 family protein [Candidatus Vampirococcus lugosii]MBS8121427.1 Acid phosphatase family membrane protein YuiD [Candidatus Vampirococcus lugosii]